MVVSQLILGGYPVSADPPWRRGPCRVDSALCLRCGALVNTRRWRRHFVDTILWCRPPSPRRLVRCLGALTSQPTPRHTPVLPSFPCCPLGRSLRCAEPRSLQARSLTSLLIGMRSRTPIVLDLLTLSLPCLDHCSATIHTARSASWPVPPISFDTHSYDTTHPE